MSKSNKITISGEEFFYNVEIYDSEYADFYTVFYKEVEVKTRKKFIFFGPIVTREVPKILFKTEFSIKTVMKTKDEVRKILERKVELLSRAEQIKKGEII